MCLIHSIVKGRKVDVGAMLHQEITDCAEDTVVEKEVATTEEEIIAIEEKVVKIEKEKEEDYIEKTVTAIESVGVNIDNLERARA
ncbi:hypothetical protein PVK06_024101 [Gossypium arboreum]|uniref:Uncharacterized protein n=1 Tax=Gossypium arboreum TaxID=29729 RepID=A0ABR0PCV3_GOSAR|nr:hypothetical protein PVK06_024101 [Gossypium arboreum]